MAKNTIHQTPVVAILCALVLLVSKGSSAFSAAPANRQHGFLALRRSSTAGGFLTSSLRLTAFDEGEPRKNNSGDFPEEELSEYKGSVDWDAEWKKVVENGGAASTDRPGKDFYKSDAEIAAIRAANKATTTVTKTAASVPTWDELKGDWKFWIGILAVISIGTSLLSASSMQAPINSSPDSYYI